MKWYGGATTLNKQDIHMKPFLNNQYAWCRFGFFYQLISTHHLQYIVTVIILIQM